MVAAVGCSREAPPKKQAPPIATVAALEPAPSPEALVPSESPPANVEAAGGDLKAALLGLNTPQPEPEPDPPPRPRAKRVRKKVSRAAEPEPFIPEAPKPPNLSDTEFQDTVNSWRGMRTCLAGSVLRGTNRRGAMRVAFKIRGDGSVSNCEVVETSNSVAATIAPCVTRSARRIRFPAWGGQEVEKQAKFVF